MPATRLRVGDGVPEPLRAGVAALKIELDIPDGFSPDVLAEAERVASDHAWPEVDATDLALVTIDPPGATDLDQAVHLERHGTGYRVRYAIADLTTFVAPGGALDAETHRRGQTLYAPHARTPLHPDVLGAGAASLLPGEDRPAVLWQIDLDAAGVVVAATVGRARVRSREQLSYADVQAALDAGAASEVLQLLREVGLKREQIEAERGGVSLQVPDQEIVARNGSWELEFRDQLPVEGWNAQISLLTGMAAAQIMLDAGVGLLRTLPPATQASVDRLRHIAKGLRIAWPGRVGYPEFVRGLDPTHPKHLAMLNASTTLFRGAGYAAFDGELPEQPVHGALAAPYTHCTAPLRRLVDRFTTQVCLSVCAGEPVPDWVRAALPDLPGTMAASDARAKRFERGITGLVEALVMAPHVGSRFDATVVSYDDKRGRGEVQLADPAVLAPVVGDTELGAEVSVVLETADLASGEVLFRV